MLEERIKLLHKELVFLKDIFFAHAENKHGPSVAGGARSTPEEGGEDEEEAFDHENVEEQFSDSHCPLKYLHQAMKQLCDGKYQDTLILDS